VSSPSGGGPSALRVGGLALIGVAVVAAVIGLAGLAANGDPSPTAAPQPAPSSTPAPQPVPPPAPPPPAEPVPTGDGGVPVPSFGETPPGEAPPPAPAPGEQPPPEGAPAPAPAPGGAPEAPGAPGDDPGAPGPPPQDRGPVGGDGNGGNGNGNGAPAPAPRVSGGGAPTGDTGGGKGGASVNAVQMPLRVYNNSTITGLATRAADDFRRAGWPIDVIGNYSQGIIPASTVYYRPGTDEEAAAHALGERFGLRVHPRFEGLKDASPGVIVIVTSDYDGR